MYMVSKASKNPFWFWKRHLNDVVTESRVSSSQGQHSQERLNVMTCSPAHVLPLLGMCINKLTAADIALARQVTSRLTMDEVTSFKQDFIAAESIPKLLHNHSSYVKKMFAVTGNLFGEPNASLSPELKECFQSICAA